MFINHSDVLIIGGNGAGLSAAVTAHRQYPRRTITLLRKEDQVLMPGGLPYLFGDGKDPKDMLIPDTVLKENSIKLVEGVATKIDLHKLLVEVDGHDSIGFERLVIATGSHPAMPPVPGFDKENVWPVSRSMKTLSVMREQLRQSKNLVIIGGGFAGVELADECKRSGIANVTIVESSPGCLSSFFDDEFSGAAQKALTDAGVVVRTNTKVTQIAGGKAVEKVVLQDGTFIPADAVIIAVGSIPDTALAKAVGLRVGPTGAIAVDRYMRTSHERIFACGDCAEKVSFFGGKPTSIKLDSIACTEGRIAGANLFGTRRENTGMIGVWSTCVANLALSCAGLTERMADELGYDCVLGSAKAAGGHPACQGSAEEVTAKLVFERRTGVILGGQLMGGKSVGDMANIVSACILKKMTIDDIATFQLGTHPALTCSPLTYPIVNAAEAAHMNSVA